MVVAIKSECVANAKPASSTLLARALFCALVLAGCPGHSHAEAATSRAGVAEGETAIPVHAIRVTDSAGNPLAGAMVSRPLDERRRITRFTDADGRLALAAMPAGAGMFRVRFPGLTERVVDVGDLSGAEGVVALSVDDQFLRKLPSSEWLSLLPDGDRKREFIINCGTCHEIGHDRIMIDGRPRNEDEWLAAIAMMRAMDAYEVIPPDFDDAGYAAWLAENLSAERIAALRAVAPVDAQELASVEITEYALPIAGSLPHDLVTGPDGRIWITAFFFDELWALTPASGEIERFPVDNRDDVSAQPRALEFDSSGMLWLVNGGTESVLRFDPGTGRYDEIPVGMYAHSIDIGPDGDIWVNDYFAEKERVARISAKERSVVNIAVPSADRPAREGLPLPYGLQVDTRGRVYSTQLAANTLVRFDSRDGSGTLFEMPEANSGPRRPGLDNLDRLWIPEFNTGALALFDPGTEAFRRVQLGGSSTGLYDVEVNQHTNEIWATGSLASTLIRYRPETGGILTVPLPTEPAYTRHIAIDEASGDVWSAYSSLPAADPRVVRLRFLE